MNVGSSTSSPEKLPEDKLTEKKGLSEKKLAERQAEAEKMMAIFNRRQKTDPTYKLGAGRENFDAYPLGSGGGTPPKKPEKS